MADRLLEITRTQYWVGELLLHPTVREEFDHFPAATRLRRIEYELRDRGDIPYSEFAHHKQLERWRDGRHSCSGGRNSLLNVANTRFAKSALPFYSPVWLALGTSPLGHTAVARQAAHSHWATYWDVANEDVDTLTSFNDLDALGCLLLHVALVPDNMDIVLAQLHTELVWRWLHDQCPAERRRLPHVRGLIKLIEQRFAGRLRLPKDLSTPPPSALELLQWLDPLRRKVSSTASW